MRLQHSLLVLFLIPFAACSRGLDGAASLPNGSTPLSSLDEDCDHTGYTGRQLLALLTPSYASEYAPTDPNSDTIDPSWFAAHETALTVTPAWHGGAVGCTAPMTLCPPGTQGCFQTGPTISVALSIAFVTADGTFDEQLDAMASWTAGDGLVSWNALLPATSVHGSYEVWSGADALGPASEVSLYFRGTFDSALAGEHSVAGEVDEQITTSNGGTELGGNGGGQFGAH